MISNRNDEGGSAMQRLATLLLVGAVLVAGCSTGGDSWTEPIPIVALTEQAATVTPASWATDPPEGWPGTVPAPSFLDNLSQISQGGPNGTRGLVLSSTSRPDEDQVAAYIALLLDVGFVHDPRAIEPGWFVRDGFEWVALQNRDLSGFIREGSSVNERTFSVQWTTNSVQLGYCAVVESGGTACRE